MEPNRQPAATVIDQVRRDYAAERLDRASAILHIRGQVDVTERGAADLLDHPLDARTRYATKPTTED